MDPERQPMTDISHLFDEKQGKAAPSRLDAILPLEGETGVVTPDALEIYVDAMLTLHGRASLPLSLIGVSLDATPLTKFLGDAGLSLISKAAARHLRQETRPHDVVGKLSDVENEAPIFVIVCPLLSEADAAKLAKRLQTAMHTCTHEDGTDCLTFSMGVAAASIEVNSANELLSRVQSTLLRARRGGTGNILRHTESFKKLTEGE